jgi:nucleoside-diphosphate-sugar epimerase
MAQRVLLVGATGAIGRALLEAFIKKGLEVTALVRDEEKGRKLVASYGSLCTFVMLPLAADNAAALRQLALGFDCVVYAASASPEVEDNTIKAFLTAGAETAAQGGLAHFVYTSGVLVYGDCGEELISETSPTAPALDFAQFKLTLEKATLEAAQDNFAISVIRPGWIYPGSYVSEYISKAREQGFLPLPQRDGFLCVVHLQDLADLYVKVVERRAGGIFNAAESVAIRSHELVRELGRLMGLEVRLVDDPATYMASGGMFILGLATSQRVTSRAESELGWRPRSIAAGLPSIAK